MRLTRDEIILVACLTLALVAGAVIKRHRDQARVLVPPVPRAAPASLPRPPE